MGTPASKIFAGINGKRTCSSLSKYPAAFETINKTSFSGFHNMNGCLYCFSGLQRSTYAFSQRPSSKASNKIRAAVTDFRRTGPSKVTRVRLIMPRTCEYGEYFLVVGDDPLLGSWDPFKAKQLTWSRNIWFIDLELPTNKCIEYKFLLKPCTGDFLWQPGPDRFFCPWETNNTLLVIEDWEFAGSQMIYEKPILYQGHKLQADPHYIIDTKQTERPFYLEKEPTPTLEDCLDVSSVPQNAAYGRKDGPTFNKKKERLGSKDQSLWNKVHQNGERVRKDRERRHRNSSGKDEEEKGSFFTSDEGPVLVPGLTIKVVHKRRTTGRGS